MPRAIQRRSDRQPKPGSRFPAEVLAGNVRAYRGVRGLSQAQLAEHMAKLGHRWSESIVGFVERGQRAVTIDEFVGLTIALEVEQLGALLDPLGPIEGEQRYYGAGYTVPKGGLESIGPDWGGGLDWGGPVPLRGDKACLWVRGKTGRRVAFRPDPGEGQP